MIWVLSQNPIFKKHIGWFAISFLLTASPQAQSQTSNIQGMTQIEANCLLFYDVGWRASGRRARTQTFASIFIISESKKSPDKNLRTLWGKPGSL
jgi:hypothetical protein